MRGLLTFWYYWVVIPLVLLLIWVVFVQYLLWLEKRSPKFEAKLDRFRGWVARITPNQKQKEFIGLLLAIGIVLFWILYPVLS